MASLYSGRFTGAGGPSRTRSSIPWTSTNVILCEIRDILKTQALKVRIEGADNTRTDNKRGRSVSLSVLAEQH